MKQNLTNAINKARQAKVHVARFNEGAYVITTAENHRYTVRFERREGVRYGRCNCAAGVRFIPCRHLVKAALLDNGIQSMRSAR
jgi:intracellular sulfur oxidation DsrE/DsrF family protein